MIDKKVNCIIPTYNAARYLLDAVNSVVNQTIGFVNINLVIINDGSTDNTEEVIFKLQEDYPEIVYISKENGGVSSARNAGLDYCQDNSNAPFTCFLDSDDKYDIRHMEVLIDFLEKNPEPDIVFIPIKYFEKTDDFHFAYKYIFRGETRVVDLTVENFFCQHVTAALYRTPATIIERYDTGLAFSEDSNFLQKILLKKNQAGWYDEELYYYLRKRIDETSVIDNVRTNPAVYERIPYYYKLFSDYIETNGFIPRVVQNNALYDIQWFRSINPTKHDFVLDIDVSLEKIKVIIENIDDNLLEQEYIPYWHRAFFKKMKYGEISLRKTPNEIEPRFYIGEQPFEGLSGNIHILFIRQRNHTLQVRGFFVKPSYEGLKLVSYFNGKYTEVSTRCSFNNDIKAFLGRDVFPALDFEVSIDLKNIRANIKYAVELYFKYFDFFLPVNIVYSHGSKFYLGNTFFIGDNAVVRKSKAKHALEIEQLSKVILYSDILNEGNGYKDPALVELYLRNIDAYRKKRIWLFMDRTTSIGDNASILFRYCCNINDDIEKYMVIPNEGHYKDFADVSTNILIYGSLEFKLLLLFAEKFISSVTLYENIVDTDISKEDFKKLIDTLSNTEEVFLQHGIWENSEKARNYLNTSKMDFDLMIVATKREYKMFLRSEIGYERKVVKLAGYPRYDVLRSSPQKIITFMPTWRNRYSLGVGIYNPNFKYTDLYDSIHALLSNERLLKAVKANGYQLIFKLHPRLYEQIADFNFSEEIEIVSNELSYNDLFEKSSLMITDYSSVAFDFVQLKKPIIYYQMAAHEGEQDNEIFNYAKDGFGDVFYDSEQTVEKIIEYIDNNCAMEKKYQHRVDKFFDFLDKNNSERTYREILKLPQRTRDDLN